MSWYNDLIAVHRKVTDAVSHAARLKSDRYFVWQEDGANDDTADDRHAEKAHTGTTDLYTKNEFDPWKDAFETALDEAACIGSWYLNSVQYEEDTGLTHYEWVWEVYGGGNV